MGKDSIKIIFKLVIDFFCLLAVGLPSLYLHLFGTPYKRGFFCDDLSIKYPYKDSTITSFMLYAVGIAVPAFIVIPIEVLLAQRQRNNWSPIVLCGKRIPLWLVNSYKAVGVYFFGVLCTVLVTDSAKYCIGRLRPHFIELCRPAINCSLPENHNAYIINFSCLGGNDYYIKQARLSFPSGHSSFSAFTMIYLSLYVQVKLKWSGSFLLKRVIQLCLISMAWCTGLSRVSDYKHHWSDVLVGFLIGTTSAVLTALCVAKFFDKNDGHFKQHQSSPNMMDKRTEDPNVGQTPVELTDDGCDTSETSNQ